MTFFHGKNLTEKNVFFHKVAKEVFINDMRYINPRFTYLLTYLVW